MGSCYGSAPLGCPAGPDRIALVGVRMGTRGWSESGSVIAYAEALAPYGHVHHILLSGRGPRVR